VLGGWMTDVVEPATVSRRRAIAAIVVAVAIPAFVAEREWRTVSCCLPASTQAAERLQVLAGLASTAKPTSRSCGLELAEF
jgi:hypothetical protein